LIEPRLASGVQISALKRLAEAEGDFATVLKKGDATSGAILLIGQVRGAADSSAMYAVLTFSEERDAA